MKLLLTIAVLLTTDALGQEVPVAPTWEFLCPWNDEWEDGVDRTDNFCWLAWHNKQAARNPARQMVRQTRARRIRTATTLTPGWTGRLLACTSN